MSSLVELQAVLGAENVIERGDVPHDDPAHYVAEPGSISELSRVLALASREGWSLVPRGSGSKMGWGAPPSAVDVVVSTRRMDSVLEHSAGDQVLTVQAGVRLDELQDRLAGSGQRLGLDPPEPGATVGGIIATNASGPRRLRYGTVRDLLIGIKIVLADGTVARAGGKVVKNVAGYDLGKLFTGSLGTLGVIAEATFRLHPLPENQAGLLVLVENPSGAGEVVRRLMQSQLTPSAVELEWSPGQPVRLIVLFEGIAAGVEAQLRGAATLLGSVAAVSDLQGDPLRRAWAAITPRPWEAGWLGLKISHLPGELADVLTRVRDAGARFGGGARIRGSATSGVLYAGVRVPDANSAAAVVEMLRKAIREGSVVVHEARADLRSSLDVWGPVRGLELMRRVKRQFDPAGLLNRGRFVGGI